MSRRKQKTLPREQGLLLQLVSGSYRITVTFEAWSCPGAFLDSEPVFVEQTQVKHGFSLFDFISTNDIRGTALSFHSVEMLDNLLEPVLSQSIMVLKLFFLNRSLVHQFIRKLNLTEVIAFSGAFIKELDRLLRFFFLLVDHSKIVVSIWIPVLLCVKEEAQGFFCVLHFHWL
jgi:hypothetical protein